MNYLDSNEVWKWEETQNFLKKLGIDLSKSTQSLTIDLEMGSLVRVTQEFYPKGYYNGSNGSVS